MARETQLEREARMNVGRLIPERDGTPEELTLTGALKTFLNLEPDGAMVSWFHERALRSLATVFASGVIPAQDEVGDMLVAAFGGDDLREAYVAGGSEGALDYIGALYRTDREERAHTTAAWLRSLN
jgi:hypothetical protein